MATGKHAAIGFFGMLGLVLVYFGILTLSDLFFSGQTLAESATHALGQFASMWYMVTILAVGFGIQTGLYSHIKSSAHRHMKGATAELAASGGISTASMAACCAHHVVDVLPALGLSAAALLLAKYQTPFVVLGIFSNLIGITVMLTIIQRHGFYSKESALTRLFSYNMVSVRNAAIVLSVLVVSASFVNTATGGTETAVAEGTRTSLNLPEIVREVNAVEINVAPLPVSIGKEVAFRISFNTHSVDLDFDMMKISQLQDDKGNTYGPVAWKGTGAGGHHRSGTLHFPKLKGSPGALKLVLRGVAHAPETDFEWKLADSRSAA